MPGGEDPSVRPSAAQQRNLGRAPVCEIAELIDGEGIRRRGLQNSDVLPVPNVETSSELATMRVLVRWIVAFSADGDLGADERLERLVAFIDGLGGGVDDFAVRTDDKEPEFGVDLVTDDICNRSLETYELKVAFAVQKLLGRNGDWLNRWAGGCEIFRCAECQREQGKCKEGGADSHNQHNSIKFCGSRTTPSFGVVVSAGIKMLKSET